MLVNPNPASGSRSVIFRRGARLDRCFRRETGSQLRGMVMEGDPLDPFPEGGLELIRAEGVRPLAQIEAPARLSDYRQRFRLSLDELGVLRVHPGEVPYWTTDKDADFLADEGRVLILPMQDIRKGRNDAHLPYSGNH
jgi:hypothetical protein